MSAAAVNPAEAALTLMDKHIENYLKNLAIPVGRRQDLATCQFRDLKHSDIGGVWRCLGMNTDHPFFKEYDEEPKRDRVTKLLGWDSRYWISPEIDLVKNAIANGAALCVNAEYEFKLCLQNYTIVSYVGSQGLRADSEGKGLQRWKVRKLFKLINKVGLVAEKKVEWIHIRSLAVPQPTDDASMLQGVMHTNHLASIYGNADGVLVFDHFLLDMTTTSIQNVAIAILMSQWFTRLWTYAETKLAREVYFMTNETYFKLSTIIEQMTAYDTLGQIVATGGPPFAPLLDAITLLRGGEQRGVPPNIFDVIRACRSRETTHEIDYARALAVVFGMPFNEKDSRDHIMARIHASQKNRAERLAFLHGARRNRLPPRWAPASLCGLTRGKLDKHSVWMKQGVKGFWSVLPIDGIEAATTQILGHTYWKARHNVTALTITTNGRPRLICVLSKEDSDQERTKIAELQDLVQSGAMFLIFQHHPAKHHGPEDMTALLVRQVEDPDVAHATHSSFIAEVFFTVAVPQIIPALAASLVMTQHRVLLQH
jgi:hypothetical protein